MYGFEKWILDPQKLHVWLIFLSMTALLNPILKLVFSLNGELVWDIGWNKAKFLYGAPVWYVQICKHICEFLLV